MLGADRVDRRADRGCLEPLLSLAFWSEGAAVNARFLLAFFDSVYVLALTAWVGSILFFSFGVAPIVFQVLSARGGGQVRPGPVPAVLHLGRDRRGDRPARLPGRAVELPGVPRPDRRGAGDDDRGRNADHAVRGQLVDPGDQRRARRRARARSRGSTACTAVRSRLNVVVLALGIAS